MLYSRSILGLCISLMLSFPAIADINTSGFAYSIYTGVTIPRINQGKLLLIGETDALVANKQQQNEWTWGLGGAYHVMIQNAPPLHDVSLGLDLFHFRTAQNGETWQYQHPSFNNFTYKLPVTSTRVMVDTEWTLSPIASNLFLFAQGGVGVAYNTASYHDTPMPSINGTGTTISSNSQGRFAYAFGGGTKIILNQKLNLSFRYVFTNLGNATTSQTANLTLLGPIKSTLSTQDWLIGLTYMA